MASARTPLGGGGPDVFAFGNIAFYAGPLVANLTPAKIRQMYLAFKLVYEGLP